MKVKGKRPGELEDRDWLVQGAMVWLWCRVFTPRSNCWAYHLKDDVRRGSPIDPHTDEWFADAHVEDTPASLVIEISPSYYVADIEYCSYYVHRRETFLLCPYVDAHMYEPTCPRCGELPPNPAWPGRPSRSP